MKHQPTAAQMEGKCGTCKHFVPIVNASQIQRRIAHRLEPQRSGFKDGVCAKMDLYCGLTSKRCGGDQYEKL